MHDKAVRLIVAGYEINTWDAAQIDSVIDTPADSWSFALFSPQDLKLPKEIKKNAPVQFFYGDELILTSVVDKVSESVDRTGYALKIEGRDLAGQLIDCSVPVFNGRQMTLDELVNKFVLGGDLEGLFKGANIQNNAWLKNKVSVEPGESIWDAIVKAAAVTGQHVWLEPDGTLSIGDPFAHAYRVSTPLRLNNPDNGNNVLKATYVEDGSNGYSEYKILGQDGNANHISAHKKDSAGSQYNRLKIINMSDLETQAEAETALSKIQKDSDMQSYQMTATYAGWSIDQKTWATGFYLNLESNRIQRATAQWAVMGRTLTLSRKDGKLTELHLNRQGDWAQPLVHKERKQ